MKWVRNIGLVTFVTLASGSLQPGFSQISAASANGKATAMTGEGIVIDSDLFPGADIGARITAAQNSLGSGKGTISVNTAGTLSTPVRITPGNDLSINAPITMTAAVTLSGSNTVVCHHGSMIATQIPALVTTPGAGDLTLSGCTINGIGTAVRFFVSTGSHIRVHANVASGLQLYEADGGDDISVDDNTITGTASANRFNAVGQIDDATNISFTHNYCNWVQFCYTTFNADANSGSVNSRSAVTAHGGHVLISANRATNVNVAYWASVAHNIIMTGNYASTCTDVCYDVEGSADVLIAANQGENGTNGVGTTFFFADHVKFTGNDFSSSGGQGLILVHNQSQSPANNESLTVSDNTLTCFKTLCQAIGGDAADHVLIDNNRLQDGYMKWFNNMGSADIRRNLFRYTRTSPTAFNALSSGLIINHGAMNVADNVCESAVPQPAGSACYSVTAGDYNSSTNVQILRNESTGFPIDISTSNSGSNAGTTVVWNVTGNYAHSGAMKHTHTGSNTDQYQVGINYLGSGYTSADPATTGTKRE